MICCLETEICPVGGFSGGDSRFLTRWHSDASRGQDTPRKGLQPLTQPATPGRKHFILGTNSGSWQPYPPSFSEEETRSQCIYVCSKPLVNTEEEFALIPGSPAHTWGTPHTTWPRFPA